MSKNIYMEAPNDNKKTKNRTKKVKEKVEEKTSEELKDKAKEVANKLTSDEEINGLKKEIESLKDKNLRLLAELDNQKKEYFKTMLELEHSISQRLIKKILPLFDSYEMAAQINQVQQNPNPEVKKYLAGFRITFTKLQRDFFQEEKIEEIKVVSQKNVSEYNSDEIEIVESEENSDYSEGTILQVSQKGYRYQEKVLRPAEVIIARKALKI